MILKTQLGRIVDKGQLGTLTTISDDYVAEQLLAIATDAFDANATRRAADYIIGSLPGAQADLTVLRGIHRDKNTGIEQLEIAAQI